MQEVHVAFSERSRHIALLFFASLFFPPPLLLPAAIKNFCQIMVLGSAFAAVFDVGVSGRRGRGAGVEGGGVMETSKQ